jgi:ribokinase
MKTVEYAVEKASQCGMKVIINPAPAPAQPFSEALLANIWLLTPNESEAELLTGISIIDTESAEAAADILISKGAKNVIITFGAKGAFVKSVDYKGMVQGVKVKAIDTTAAGDVFNGALAVALAEGRKLRESVVFANKAAAISVTRMGAQASAPFRNEIKEDKKK